MGTKDDQALIGRAMLDPAFRRRLLEDAEGTVRAEGLDVSPALLGQFRAMDAAAAEQVGRVIGALFQQREVGELSDDEAAAVAGGSESAQQQFAGVQLLRNPGALQHNPTLPDFDQPFVAPTTW